MNRLRFLLIAVPVLAAAQSVPPKRAHHTIFYDEAGQRVLLTGGSTPLDSGRRFEFFNDLWAFDGTSWKPLEPSGDRVSGTRIALDARGRIVSFGGYRGSSIGDLRVLENDRWRTLAMHPSLRSAEPGFVFDAARNRFVAFGGTTGPRQIISDVWEYDGTTWSRSVAPPPPARAAHAMVYDARRQRTIVFGGMGGADGGQPTMLGDTWEFDGKAWKQIPVSGPAPRVSPGAAYDSRRGLVILFGGSNQQGLLGDLWSWDGATWKLLADDGPEPRSMGYITYDQKRDRIVLFGGRKGYPDGDLNDTWEWDGARWKRIAP